MNIYIYIHIYIYTYIYIHINIYIYILYDRNKPFSSKPRLLAAVGFSTSKGHPFILWSEPWWVTGSLCLAKRNRELRRKLNNKKHVGKIIMISKHRNLTNINKQKNIVVERYHGFQYISSI